MNLPNIIKLAAIVVTLLAFPFHVIANTPLDSFLSQVKTVTYDCPNPAFREQLNQFLTSENLSESHRFQLLVNQTHYQNCNGENNQAQDTLKAIISDPKADKSTEYFASATYQLGFTYDVQERDERCIHYGDALRLSEGKFVDIEMSATLGLITNCPQSGYSNDSERLAAYFALVEKYAESGNFRALAHIHNSIGLFFGAREQHVLAADQYLKAHEMGQNVYTGSNRLSILISAITSLLGSGQYDRAYEAIEDFALINQEVGTPLTDFWYYYAKSGYYYRTNKIAELEKTLPLLAEILPKVDTRFYRGLYRWYSAVPCLYHKDLVCLKAFVDIENKLSDAEKPYASYDYHKFLVRSNMAIGDLQAANMAFENSIQRLDDIKQNQDGLARVIGIANLYSQIYVLENKIILAERRKEQITVGAILLLVLVVVVIAYFIRKRRIALLSIDPVTKLLNSKTAVHDIAKLDLPSEGKINALAIFDLGNFREVNRQVGSTKGDYVLQKIASTLTKVTRNNDILGRFAPEQFILCLRDIEEGSAKSFFERVQEALENTFLDDQHGVDISVRSSMSIYITNEKFNDLHTILDDMLLSLSIKPSK
ncbi:GGDEF domain-containing protein [Glaciecola sp. SC05]|uniref:GGDEF domain-containing protein n=1 Tax=Glaciecola sp. SC05 TaxID=1987355 RepID=UPI00352831D2